MIENCMKGYLIMIKVGVFLGYSIAYNVDNWKKQYKQDKVNDTLPYGYDRAESNDVNVQYIKLNKIEKKIFFNKYLQYAYLYFIKLPILLFKYDIIWTHYDEDGLFIAKLRGIPLLKIFMSKQIANFVWLIDSSKNYSKTKIKNISKLLNRIDKVIYHSPTETEKFLSVFELSSKKIQCVHFGINFNAYSDKKPMIKPSELDDNFKNYILSVGTDVHRDIELLDKLAYKMKDKHFILCSCNPKYLNKKYKSNNLKVINANLCEMRYLYKNCSCVVIPLKYNEHVSGCTTLLEAAAMKKPVVISDIPGIRDYVLDDRTGIIAPIGDVDSFKTAVFKLINDKNYAQMLGNNAYKYTKDEFTTEKWAMEHARISKQILNIN